MCLVLSPMSVKELVLKLAKRAFLYTSVLLRYYYAFVLSILQYCSHVWVSVAGCHLQLLELQVYSVASLSPDHTFLLLCHRLHVAGCTVYVVQG